MQKDRIICLVGESGSGKTTIAELLEKEGYNHIESYTTRPKRFEGERGHIFVNEDKYLFHNEDNYLINMYEFKSNENEKYLQPINAIAYTFYNNNHYWATREQYQGKGTTIYIVDVPGVEKLKEKVKDAEIVVIYLKTDIENRFNRMMVERGFNDAIKRIEHDKINFKLIECDYVVDANRPTEEVLGLVKEAIGGIQ